MSSSAALVTSSSAPHLMRSNAPPPSRHPMSRSAPQPMDNSAPQHTRPPTRRSAPPPTSRCAPALGMAGMAREVLDMDRNNPAPRSPRRAAPVSQCRNLSRNVPLFPRKVVNRWQCRHQEKAAPLYPRRAAPGCPRRTAAVFLYKLLPRWPRRSAVVVVMVAAQEATMDRVVVGIDTMDLHKNLHLI